MKRGNNVLSQGNVQNLAKKANDLVLSAKGRNALEKAIQNAEETTTKLSKDRYVDPQSLRIPLII